MQFDLLSDVHLDEIEDKNICEIVKQVVPKNPSEILVFAGDFGFENKENIDFIKELKKYYLNILYVYGNNDLKIKKISEFKDVKERVEKFEEEIDKISGVIRLTEQSIKINNIKFIGSDIFYDYKHIMKKLNVSKQEVDERWKKLKLDDKHRGWIENPYKFSEVQKRKLLLNIKDANVLVTHGPPDYFDDPTDLAFGFFKWDGEEFKSKIKDKTWCFGHSHQRLQSKKYGCRFFNAAFQGEREPNIIQIKV